MKTSAERSKLKMSINSTSFWLCDSNRLYTHRVVSATSHTHTDRPTKRHADKRGWTHYHQHSWVVTTWSCPDQSSCQMAKRNEILPGTAGNNRLESIQRRELNRIPVEFDLSGHLQSRCQQCVPIGNKTGANCIILLLYNTSHSNLELIPVKKY